jgi:predicted O-methyltransferase YrrM
MQTSKDGLFISFTEEYKDLIEIRKSAASRKIPVIEIESGRVLEVISLICQPKEILEIGCGIGFSTYFILKNLKMTSYIGIDLNSARLLEAEKFIKSCFEGLETDFIAGNALKIIPKVNKLFDFVFIDAAKYEYPKYLETIMGKTKKSSVIIADNVLYKNKVLKEKILEHDKNSVSGIKRYIESVSDKELFDTTIIDIGDGLSVSVRRS